MEKLENQTQFMKMALNQAKIALKKQEVPVGAIIVKKGAIISQAYNLRESLKDPLGHAEIQAIQKASRKLNSWRLEGCEIYVSLEPCLMCLGAILQARLSGLIYSADDPKAGFSSYYQLDQQTHWRHKIQIQPSLLKEESKLLLQLFFKKLREKNQKKKLL